MVLISTALTVLIEYSMLRADDEDSLSAGSQEPTKVDSYYYGDGQNKQASVEKDEQQKAHEDQLMKNEQNELDEYNKNRDGFMTSVPRGGGDSWAGQARASIRDIFPTVGWKGEVPQVDGLQVLASSKQIISEA